MLPFSVVLLQQIHCYAIWLPHYYVNATNSLSRNSTCRVTMEMLRRLDMSQYFLSLNSPCADPSGRLVALVSGSNPARDMALFLLFLYVVLSCIGRGLCDGLITSSRRVLPGVCMCVIKKPRNGRPNVHPGLLAPVDEWMNETIYDYPLQLAITNNVKIILSSFYSDANLLSLFCVSLLGCNAVISPEEGGSIFLRNVVT
jgi:hypothetical protein